DAAGTRDWRGALLAGLGVPVAATTTILMTAGATLMGNAAKVGLGVAAAAAFAAVVFVLGGTPPPATPGTGAGTAMPASAATPAPAMPDSRPDARRTVAADQPLTPALAHPFAFDLQIEVRDRDGLPVEGAQAWLAPLGCALCKVPAKT